MFIEPNWHILTVGDGDLSFSYSLHQLYPSATITATVLDSETELLAKYSQNYLVTLRQQQVEVKTGFDVLDNSSWQGIEKQYDLVIFQFPLVPNSQASTNFSNRKHEFGEAFSINTLNRSLLRRYLQNCFNEWLSTDGARLAYITSKNVKPYTEWNIEFAIAQELPITLLGKTRFYSELFTHYQLRNVDRDKYVKFTGATTYIWSDNISNIEELKNIFEPIQLIENEGCKLCQAGPFITEQEKQAHVNSRKHKRMVAYDSQWQLYLNS